MAKADLLFLNNKAMEACGVLDMREAIKDVEATYVLTEKGDVILPGKLVTRWGTTPEDENRLGRINAMPGYIGGDYNMAGIKWIGSGPQNYKRGLPRASVTVILNDPDTKLPVCIADGTAVSAKRTGASGGIAARELSIRNASVMLICGAGAQARTQLEAIKLTRPTIRKVFVYDIRPESTAAFIREMGPMYPDIEFVATDTPETGAREADIVDCVTLADSPIIEADWIKPGALLMNMADFEMTYDCVRKSAKIVVDNWENVKHRMISTVALMARDGLIRDEDIHAEMGQILLGKKPARETDDEIIYFNAVGSGLMDIAVVTRCYRKALKEGLGVTLPYWE